MSVTPTIRIYSFSYHSSGPPADPTGNNGGFVFDCRGLPNPGRVPDLKHFTGIQGGAKEMLDDSFSVKDFLERAEMMIKLTSETFRAKGFRDLMVSFGCTGGRHRSVYCAQKLYDNLTEEGYDTHLVHWQMEQEEPEYSRKRAMILAAGLGTRLRPITDTIPKALVKASEKTMLQWTIEALNDSGCTDITLNTHHHAPMVKGWVEDYSAENTNINLKLSNEKHILGTGGGIREAARWLYGPSPFLIHNVDIWSDFDLNRLYHSHENVDLATLICQERESSSYLLVDESDRLCGLRIIGQKDKVLVKPFGKLRPLGFSGIHICSPRFLELLAGKRHFSIIDAYLEFSAMGETVRTITVQGNWFDMGSPEKLKNLEDFLVERTEHATRIGQNGS
ncbi:NTP transferase domain-containing protein [bacterium]|nr:NTP transferase domain-containing protein [bacterium]